MPSTARELAEDLQQAPTLWSLLDRRTELTPDAPVLIQAEDGRQLTFAELRAAAERTAAGLYEQGVRAGTRFVWQLPTRIETAVLTFALARLGAVQSPVMPMYRDREVGYALRETGAEWLAIPGREWRGYDYGALAERVTEGLGSAGSPASPSSPHARPR
ncbi:AMP-binding protein, partial [Streptomyces sp. A7024]